MTKAINRRNLLTTLGKAFGAGGFILANGRAGALALPSNLDAAASLPLTTAPLPLSPDLVQWRGLVDELHAFRMQTRRRNGQAYSDEWRARAMAIRDVDERIARREQTTWADCVELAEICWRAMPKEGWSTDTEITGRLSRDRTDVHMAAGHCAEHLVALIEAVLTLGNGERRDPKTDQGRF